MSGRPYAKASSRPGRTDRSSDGRLWESRQDNNGTWRWYLVSRAKTSGSKRPASSVGKRSSAAKRASGAKRSSAAKRKRSSSGQAVLGGKRSRQSADAIVLLTRPEMSKAKKAFDGVFQDDYQPKSIRNSFENLLAVAGKRNASGERMVVFYDESKPFPFFFVFAVGDDGETAVPLLQASAANFKPHLLDITLPRSTAPIRLPAYLKQKI